MKKILFIVVVFIAAIQFELIDNPFSKKTEPVAFEPFKGTVILYATTWCSYCKLTRELFEDKKIPYKEYDIEESAIGQKKYNMLNVSGVPVVVIGDEVIHGYDPDTILALTGRN